MTKPGAQGGFTPRNVPEAAPTADVLRQLGLNVREAGPVRSLCK